MTKHSDHPPLPWRRIDRATHLIFLALFAGSGLVAPARADRTWVQLDASPEGTPADVILDLESSDESMTRFDLLVHGFWVEEKRDPAGRSYQKISVPGMGSLNEPGSPDLPAFRASIALATDARVGELMVEPMDRRDLPGYLIWPQVIEELDHPGGSDEQFIIDDGDYRLTVPYPQVDGVVAPTKLQAGIPAMEAVFHPVKWIPATGLLQITVRSQWTVFHGGSVLPAQPITRERTRVVGHHFLNWSVIAQFYPPNFFTYEADYLFIYPEAYDEELAPLVLQKWSRGFNLEVRFTEETGTTCEAIRTAINNWYNSTPWWHDHYCLLVGDVNIIPFCTAPTGAPTDDLYASTDGDDLFEEVYLGRLSVDNAGDLIGQVQKILAYENSGAFGCDYRTAALVAHLEDAPAKYEGAHESVRTASYTHPPNFLTLYGSTGATNADVSLAIQDGLGLVAYRGHGSETEWWQWNLAGESYENEDVSSLENYPCTPVVWSFACDNDALGTSDCIGETWLEGGGQRAVSHYGSSIPSYTVQNHELDRRMFKAVYDLGLTTQSHAIEYAEAQMMHNEGSENAWMYNLLGDPDMQIRRDNLPVFPYRLFVPDHVFLCDDCTFDVRVLDQAGDPVEGVLVAAYKPGAGPLLSAEVFANRYTDADGAAQVPASPQSPGWLYYTVQDDMANAAMDSVQVLNPADVPQAGSVGIRFRATPSVTQGETLLQFGRPLSEAQRIAVYDGAGRQIRTLLVDGGASSVLWDGRDNAGRAVSSGIYLIRLQSPGRSLATRVVLVR